MEIKAKKDFEMYGKYYEVGDTVDIPSKDMLMRLNEKGFIYPLTPKQLQEWKKETPMNIYRKKGE